jgi:hypothetical protein
MIPLLSVHSKGVNGDLAYTSPPLNQNQAHTIRWFGGRSHHRFEPRNASCAFGWEWNCLLMGGGRVHTKKWVSEVGGVLRSCSQHCMACCVKESVKDFVRLFKEPIAFP